MGFEAPFRRVRKSIDPLILENHDFRLNFLHSRCIFYSSRDSFHKKAPIRFQETLLVDSHGNFSRRSLQIIRTSQLGLKWQKEVMLNKNSTL